MNVEAATMTMPHHEAREAYKAYQAQLKSPKASREDLMLYRAYRSLARGAKVIDAPRAIVFSGLNSTGYPKLAICRADATWCYLDSWMFQGEFRVVFSHRGHRWAPHRGDRIFDGEVAIPARELNSQKTGRAKVPLIPPQYRPTGELEKYHILWEANWQDVPVDPLLLKHIDGPFYVVLAAWDLTLVEQSVLRMRP